MGISFRTKLEGAAFGSNFAEQLSGAALESFGELSWGAGLDHSSFGATALRQCFGEQFWEAAAGNRFGEQLWGAALGSSFVEQVLGATVLASFPEQLCRTIAWKNSKQ